MDEPLKGADYRALRRLSTKDNKTVAEVGATCEHVPVQSLPWLLASGKIKPVSQPAPAVPVSVEPERRVSAPHPAAAPRRRKGEA